MSRITNAQDLSRELQRLQDVCQQPNPSRMELAVKLQRLAHQLVDSGHDIQATLVHYPKPVNFEEVLKQRWARELMELLNWWFSTHE